jgi:hypothetical protein
MTSAQSRVASYYAVDLDEIDQRIGELQTLEIRIALHYCLPSAEALTSPYAHPPTHLQVMLIVKLPSGMVLLCSLRSNGS